MKLEDFNKTDESQKFVNIDVIMNRYETKQEILRDIQSVMECAVAQGESAASIKNDINEILEKYEPYTPDLQSKVNDAMLELGLVNGPK